MTSREAVAAFVRPLLGTRRRARGGPSIEVWAAGPATAASLRRAGWPGARVSPEPGARGIARALAGRAARRIVYPRSDRADAGLGRSLRARGHTVLEIVAYRSVPGSPPKRGLFMGSPGFDFVAATSPSAVEFLRAVVPRAPFRRLCAVPLVALGPTTARAARRLGFRRIEIPEERSGQGFTEHLLRLRSDAPV